MHVCLCISSHSLQKVDKKKYCIKVVNNKYLSSMKSSPSNQLCRSNVSIENRYQNLIPPSSQAMRPLEKKTPIRFYLPTQNPFSVNSQPNAHQEFLQESHLVITIMALLPTMPNYTRKTFIFTNPQFLQEIQPLQCLQMHAIRVQDLVCLSSIPSRSHPQLMKHLVGKKFSR